MNGLLTRKELAVDLTHSPVYGDFKDLSVRAERQFLEPSNIYAGGKKKRANKGHQGLVGCLFTKRTVVKGQKPCVRSELGGTNIGSRFIFFGGQATKLFNDVRSLFVTPEQLEWGLERPDTKSQDFEARIGHSFHGFERYAIIFGGCGPYNKEIHRRHFFNDVIAFDTSTQTPMRFTGSLGSRFEEIDPAKTKFMKTACSYTTQVDIENIEKVRQFGAMPPSQRAFHGSCVFGAGLFVHGGNESHASAPVMDDWHLFDFGLATWIEITVQMKPREGELVSDLAFMAHRKMHTITPIMSPYTPRTAINSRIPWIQDSTSEIAGIYLFGGVNGLTETPSNDLFRLRPDYRHNKRAINHEGEYKTLAKPSLNLFAEKLEPTGHAPLPRYQQTVCYF